MLMDLSYVCKMVEIHHKRKNQWITSLILTLKFQLFWINFIIISKNALKFLNIFDVGIIFGFKIGVTKKNFFFFFAFPLHFHFSQCFKKENQQIVKCFFEKKK
jgi:hypothetical protein